MNMNMCSTIVSGDRSGGSFLRLALVTFLMKALSHTIGLPAQCISATAVERPSTGL